MTKVITDPDTGEDIEVYTKDEVEQTEQEKQNKEQELEETRQELEKQKKVIAEKNENFKKYKDMSEEERNALDANQIEMLKQNDHLEDQIQNLKQEVETNQKNEIEAKKNEIFKQYAGDDEETLKQLKDNWEIINIEGNDSESLQRRGELAARMAGIDTSQGANPLNQRVSGQSPQLNSSSGNEGDTNEKVDAAAQTVAQEMGLELGENNQQQ